MFCDVQLTSLLDKSIGNHGSQNCGDMITFKSALFLLLLPLLIVISSGGKEVHPSYNGNERGGEQFDLIK